MKKKHLASLVAVAAAAALALSGCGSSNPSNNSSDGANMVAEGDTPVLAFAKPDGPLTNNSNPFVGTSAARGTGYAYAIYESLVQANTLDPTAEPTPWLASAWQWNEDYTSITYTIRDDVKWSDGQALTPDDVAFSFQVRKDNGALNGENLPYGDITVNGQDVTISFTSSQYVNTNKVYGIFIVPKHIWENVADITKDLNQDPVGSGPYLLDSWTQQAIILKANPDYWGGEPAVKTIQYQSYNDNTALLNALVAGDVQWGWGYIANYKDVFLAKDADYVSWFPSGLSFDGLWFNTAKEPFDDVTLRQAVSMVIDRQQLSDTGSTGAAAPLTSVTGLPLPVGESFVADQYKDKTYEVDVDGAKQLLTDAGYTGVGEENSLTDPDGNKVEISVAVPSGWNDYQMELEIIAQAMQKQLGMTVTVEAPTADTWSADLASGNFDATLHWTDGGSTPYDIYSDIMNGTYLKPIGEQAVYNFGRFDSADATTALATYANAATDEDRAAALDTIESIFIDQVPVVPLLERPSWGQYSEKYYTGWPTADDPYADINMTMPTATLILTKMEPVA
ncbi:MAG: ABC transporter substrate-binding protein [Propionibacteriaceae bacterium]|jgi:peptide/nickel transport system substrate-binding protein|nr:ABC transporter substrate-binding protein [Propionibacteriaceae bacterium]